MLKKIHETIEASLQKHRLDWRTCYTNVYHAEPDGSVVIVESSDDGVLQDVQEWVGSSPPGEEARRSEFANRHGIRAWSSRIHPKGILTRGDGFGR